MHSITYLGRCLAFLSFLTVVAHEDLIQLLASADMVTKGFDWEWVLIRINSVEGPLDIADLFSQADTQVVVTALDAVEPSVPFDKPLSMFESTVQTETNSPQWYEIGMVAYQKNSVSQLEVVLQEQDVLYSEKLIQTTVDLPVDHNTWTDLLITQGSYTLNISLCRSNTPVFDEQEHEQMNLTDTVFDLEDGSKAVLSYATSPSNERAVLYLAGKEDSFNHPHLLNMYREKGYDFFALDPRLCGRSRRFLDESTFRLAHSIGNFDIYSEEIGMALDFIRSQNKAYTKPLIHAHSTGALMALNYALLVEGEPFDGYVLNGPFLDWGKVSPVEKLALSNAGVLRQLGVKNLVEAQRLTAYNAKLWILHRFNTTARPIVVGHVTTEWAQASTDVHHKILQVPESNPITNTPVLHIGSLGDTVLLASESQARMPHIAANYSEVILTYNSHDVTYSATKELNEDAVAAISAWLDSAQSTSFGTQVGSA